VSAPDPVNHPAHYKGNGIEAIDVIEGFGLGFHLGNTVKYALRAGRKDSELQDLRKARWYLDRRIATLTGQALNAANVLAQYRLCYFATPYTKYPAGLDAAFQEAARLAATFVTAGVRVYSPIAHTHPLAIAGNLDPLDLSVWLPFDEAMMDASDCLIVAMMDGWDVSAGIKHEIEFFKRDGKPVLYFDPVSLGVSPHPPVSAEAS
jgi:hypothetical protein